MNIKEPIVVLACMAVSCLFAERVSRDGMSESVIRTNTGKSLNEYEKQKEWDAYQAVGQSAAEAFASSEPRPSGFATKVQFVKAHVDWNCKRQLYYWQLSNPAHPIRFVKGKMRNQMTKAAEQIWNREKGVVPNPKAQGVKKR